MNRRTARPALITDAARSQEDQLRTRQNRYIAMMSLRMVCLVAAVVLASVQPPLVWLWVGLCAAGMILLPWIAVMLANDRLPKERHRLHRHRPDPAGHPQLRADPHRRADHGFVQPGSSDSDPNHS